MALHNKEQAQSKLTLRLFGLLDEFISLIPDGKKSAYLNQLVTESLVFDNILSSLIIVFGQKEGLKIYRKAKKLTNGIQLESNRSLIEGAKNNIQNNVESKAYSGSESFKKDDDFEESNSDDYGNYDPMGDFSLDKKAVPEGIVDGLGEGSPPEDFEPKFDFEK